MSKVDYIIGVCDSVSVLISLAPSSRVYSGRPFQNQFLLNCLVKLFIIVPCDFFWNAPNYVLDHNSPKTARRPCVAPNPLGTLVQCISSPIPWPGTAKYYMNKNNTIDIL